MRILFSLFVFLTIHASASEQIESFIKKYKSSFQDVFVNGKTILNGTNLCAPRYELIKPILNEFNRPFSVLDIGAAQGYFDFKISYDYPGCDFTLIEGSLYSGFGDMLSEICAMNNEKKIRLIKERITIDDLCILSKNEHFDVIIAFLIIHQLGRSLEEKKQIIDVLQKLGDKLLIEVSTDVDVELASYVDSLTKNSNCTYLGELPRRSYFKKDSCFGKFYLFN